jgi:hypothetical protein
MDNVTGLLIGLAALLVFDVLALRFGFDSRDFKRAVWW